MGWVSVARLVSLRIVDVVCTPPDGDVVPSAAVIPARQDQRSVTAGGLYQVPERLAKALDLLDRANDVGRIGTCPHVFEMSGPGMWCDGSSLKRSGSFVQAWQMNS